MLVATALDSPKPALLAAKTLTEAAPMGPVRRLVVETRRLHPRSPGSRLFPVPQTGFQRPRKVYWVWNCPRLQMVAGPNSGHPNCWAAAVVQRLMIPRRYLDL